MNFSFNCKPKYYCASSCFFAWHLSVSVSLCLSISVFLTCLQSDTDYGDACSSWDTAQLMDLSRASERQQSPASEGMKHKGKEFKRFSLSSSFGLKRHQKKEKWASNVSHLTSSTLRLPSIICGSLNPNPFIPLRRGVSNEERFVKEISYLYFISKGRAFRRPATFHLNYVIYLIFESKFQTGFLRCNRVFHFTAVSSIDSACLGIF